MWHARHRAWHVVRAINDDLKKPSVSPVVPSPQASRLIVTFDEHVISNNFKFGVIYQKLGQVCSPSPPCSLTRLAAWNLRPLPRSAPPQGLSFPGLWEVLLPAFSGVQGRGSPGTPAP